MNKVWEIREHYKDGHEKDDDRQMRGMSFRRSKMSGYKDKESYEYGYKEGYCAALDAMEDFLEMQS